MISADNIHFTLDEAGMQFVGDLIAGELRAGDVLALSGDLGAGKTTLARAIIRAWLDADDAEVPSPTFALAQIYDGARGRITHFDFYRLESVAEAAETGLDEAIALGATLVEWPERAASLLPADRLDIRIGDIDNGDRRRLTFSGLGGWQKRIGRLAGIHGFLVSNGMGDARVRPLAGDASTRRYLRLRSPGRGALLMDAARQPDGPPIRDGRPYSRIAHLAEDVRPFVAVALHLRRLGLSAPEIYAQDLDAGLLLLEDLGDRV